MCVGIPMRIVSVEGWLALTEGRYGPETIDLSLLGQQPVGTWLLCLNGVAREVIDAETAQQIDSALDGLEAALRGQTDVSAYFADLITREPELPEHLRRA